MFKTAIAATITLLVMSSPALAANYNDTTIRDYGEFDMPVGPQEVPGRGNEYYFTENMGDAPVETRVIGQEYSRVHFANLDGDGAQYVQRYGGNSFQTFWGPPFPFTMRESKYITYGKWEDIAIFGDWDGDGKETLGTRRGNTMFLSNTFTSGWADEEFTYGRKGDEIFVGDWDGDGKDTPMVRRGNIMYFKNDFTSGWADYTVRLGRPGDRLLVGDWDGDGKDTFALQRGTSFYYINSMDGKTHSFEMGKAGDIAFSGDFFNSGKDSIGLRRPSVSYGPMLGQEYRPEIDPYLADIQRRITKYGCQDTRVEYKENTGTWFKVVATSNSNWVGVRSDIPLEHRDYNAARACIIYEFANKYGSLSRAEQKEGSRFYARLYDLATARVAARVV